MQGDTIAPSGTNAEDTEDNVKCDMMDIEPESRSLEERWAWRLLQWAGHKDRSINEQAGVKDKNAEQINDNDNEDLVDGFSRAVVEDAYYKLHPLLLTTSHHRYPSIDVDGVPEYKTAFQGPDGSIEKIESELGLAFNTCWYDYEDSSWHSISAHVKSLDRSKTVMKHEVMRSRLARADEVLAFWKWCTARDKESKITLTTFLEAFEELKKADSDVVRNWREDKIARRIRPAGAALRYVQRMDD